MENITKEDDYRFYYSFYSMLLSIMPRPAGVHIYSKGTMYDNVYVELNQNGINVEISRVTQDANHRGADYSHYALGYRDDGSKRTPRTMLERMNFSCLKTALTYAGRLVAKDVEVNI